MMGLWRRYEGPTWLVAFAIYGGWVAVAVAHRTLVPCVALPIAIYVTAWHSSLQHETIHALRRVPRWLRTGLALPPLGIWFPYELYRREHVRHHATRDLTGPDDPERFYVEPDEWSAMPGILRQIYRVNQTLAGRLIVGPALLLCRTYAGELGRVRAGDRRNVWLWIRHGTAVAVILWGLDVLAGIDPLTYVALVAYPAAALGLVRSFAEHRAAGDPADRTVTVVSRGALSLLFLNNNFHAAHHAMPDLPWYQLPASWRSGVTRSAAAYAGYRSIARAWLVRPIDSPVRPAAHGVAQVPVHRASVPLPIRRGAA
jgi:fatty acid desaturase